MLLTSLAMVDLETRGEPIGALLRALLDRMRGRRQAAAPFTPPLRIVPPDDVAPVAREVEDALAPVTFPWRRHPQLLGREADGTISLGERRARAAVVRGLFNAHTGDYEAARLAFAEAAREPAIDLSAAPGFWHLPRAGLMAAVLAYEDVDRLRAAATLTAEITRRLRPRVLRPPGPTRQPRAAASGD
jgi:hypothetical protein